MVTQPKIQRKIIFVKLLEHLQQEMLSKTGFPTFTKYIMRHKEAITPTVSKISRLEDRR